MTDKKDPSQPAKRGPGRPRKSDIQANSPGGRKKVGRPKGDAAVINEYKARMLSSPKSKAVLDKVFEVALDDEHKNQAACMKMVMDRIAPTSFFEKDKKQSGVSGVSITITHADPSAGITIDGESADDAEFEPV